MVVDWDRPGSFRNFFFMVLLHHFHVIILEKFKEHSNLIDNVGSRPPQMTHQRNNSHCLSGVVLPRYFSISVKACFRLNSKYKAYMY